MCSLADLMDPHRARGAAGILAKAITAGYIDAFCIDYAQLRVYANELCKSDKQRIKAAGARLQMAMAMHDLKLMEIADKSDRLDGGLPTENLHVKYLGGVDPGDV